MGILASLPFGARHQPRRLAGGVALAGLAAGAAAAALLLPRDGTGRRRLARPRDDVLRERVRSRLARLTSHPGAIDVTSLDGVIALRGAVLAGEADLVLSGVRRVRGVVGVEDHLERHASAASVGGAGAPAPAPAVAPEQWTGATRLAAMLVGAGLATAGMSARIPGALSLGAIGALLTLRGATNRPLKRVLGIGARPRAPRQP
jgi:BON domain